MKEIYTEEIIKAPVSNIWEILTNKEKLPAWNPFIKSLKGDLQPGKTIEVFLQPPGMSGMKIKPKVLVFEVHKEFRWKGKLWMGGIFDGEHYFILEDLQDGTVKFVHGEKFNGILVPFMGGILKKTKAGFELMNRALKERCEH